MRTLLPFLLLLLSHFIVLAQPGTLISDFDDDGIFTADLSTLDEIQDAAEMSDGSIVVSGYVSKGNQFDGLVMRISSEGEVLWSNEVDILNANQSNFFNGITVWNDEIYVQSNSFDPVTNAFKIIVIKFDSDGGRDLNWGLKGTFSYAVGTGVAGFEMLQDEEGNLYVIGRTLNFSTSLEDGILLKINSDGTLDENFGNDGVAVLSVGSFRTGLLDGTISSDGSIFVVGWFRNTGDVVGEDENGVIMKVNPDGTLETDFGINGMVSFDEHAEELITGIEVLEDGKILAIAESGPGDDDIYIRRYNSNGMIDQSFGSNGTVITDLGDDDDAKELLLRPDGGFYVAASVGDEEDFALFSYTEDGNLDPAFSDDGILVVDIEGNDNLSEMIVLQNGNIILVGESNEDVNGDVAVVMVEGFPTCSDVEVNEVISGCESVDYGGITYVESGFFTITTTTEDGCDSTVMLAVTILEESSEEVSFSSCDPVELNGDIFTESGTFTQLLINAAGCDSTLIVMVEILAESMSSISVSECETAMINDVLYEESGLYTQVLTNAAGCDSTLNIEVEITELSSQVTLVDGVLSAVNSADEYQWIDCNSNSEIEGATDSLFTTAETGSYALISTAGMCKDTSECVEVIISSLSETGLYPEVEIYPNPVQNHFVLTGLEISDNSFVFFDLSGRELRNFTRVENRFDLTGFSPGIYLLSIMDKGQAIKTVKVIKQ